MPVATPGSGTLEIRLDRLLVPDTNIREIDHEWVESLRRSIRARGKLVEPVEVIPADPSVHGDRYDHVLVAGFHRDRAARLEGLETIPGFYGDVEEQDTDRAIENMMKKPLNAHQEALAVRAMLDQGKTVAGVADLLNWDPRRVTARIKLLELPERAQQLVGDRTIALSAVDGMRAIAQVNPSVLESLLEFVVENADELEPDDLAHRPLEILGSAVEAGAVDPFIAPLSEVPAHDDALQLDDETLALVDEAAKLNHRLIGYPQPPRFRFSDMEVDRARAAGVLIEYGDETPLIADRLLYQDLCAATIANTVDALRQRLAERAAEQATRASQETPEASTKPTAPDALDELSRSHRAAMRQFAASAHSANLDLGDSLRSGLAVIDPADIRVARFFVYALLGVDTTSSFNVENHVAAIALRGIRLVIDEFREDVTKTKQDGTAGALRIVYGDGRDHGAQSRWLWKYLDGARTAGELYGRALVVIAAEHYASRLVLPAAQQHEPLGWPSQKGAAVTALERLAGPHVAKSLKALERAVKKAKDEYDADQQQIVARRRATTEPARPEPQAPSAAEEPSLDGDHAAASQPLSARTPAVAATNDDEPAMTATSAVVANPPRSEPAGAAVASVPDRADVVDASEQIDF